MSYLHDENCAVLTEPQVKDRLEELTPLFCKAVKEAAAKNAALVVYYNTLFDPTRPLTVAACKLAGEMIRYAAMHNVHLLIMPEKTGDMKIIAEPPPAQQKP